MTTPAPLTVPCGEIKLTYEDYPNLPDDGKRYEIIEGELAVTPAPTTRHQIISRNILFQLMTSLKSHGNGEILYAPVDVVFDNESIVQPDLVYVAALNTDIIGEQNITGTPDLLVEILSPSTRRRDVLTKSKLYAHFGVPAYWIVDPDLDRVETFRLEEGGYRSAGCFTAPESLRSEVFPELELRLDDIFAR